MNRGPSRPGKVRISPPSTTNMSEAMRALIIRAPYVDWILDGKKAWELRGGATKLRGRIGLIEKGAGVVVGTCELVRVHGPLTRAALRTNAAKMNASPDEFDGDLYYGDHTYAWELAAPRRLPRPVRYEHPAGAVIWVKLTDEVRAQVGE